MRGRVVAPGLFWAIGLLAVRVDDCGRGSTLAVLAEGSGRDLDFAVSAFSGLDVRDSGDDFDRVASTFDEVLSSENVLRDVGGCEFIDDLSDVGVFKIF